MEEGERAEQIREFRAERIDEIRSRGIPIDLEDGPVLVLHVIPFSAFGLGNEIDVTRAQPTQEGAPRALHLDENTYRYTLDGIETYARPVGEQQSDYTRTYRSGIIEAVTTRFCYPGSGAPPEAIDGGWIRRALEELLQRFCYFLYRQEVRPPYAIALTIVDAEGLPIRKRTEGTRYPIDRSIAELPVEVIERVGDVPSKPRATSDEPGVRPPVDEPFGELIDSLMDILWNAAGNSQELR